MPWRTVRRTWFRIFPRHLQAWPEVNELPDSELMRDDRWLVWRLGRACRAADEGEPDVLLENG